MAVADRLALEDRLAEVALVTVTDEVIVAEELTFAAADFVRTTDPSTSLDAEELPEEIVPESASPSTSDAPWDEPLASLFAVVVEATVALASKSADASLVVVLAAVILTEASRAAVATLVVVVVALRSAEAVSEAETKAVPDSSVETGGILEVP